MKPAWMLVWAAPLWAADSCLECHSALSDKLQAPAVGFAQDVHSHRGFHCTDCHGGDRNAGDAAEAMSRARGFLGKIDRLAVPRLCARCHSDANLMRKYQPQQRVDQLAQYQTSVHGKRLAAGDRAVANCVDCHSVHDIRAVKDPLAPVHPLRLPDTCGRCHADAQRMRPYKLAVNQLEEYRRSVHWAALAQRGDASAPSCASCHGNHGATPPQVSAVTAVCGTCHALMEDLFNGSPHQPVFKAMGEAGCITCHGNHAVLRPSTAWLAAPDGVCSRCHEASSAGGRTAAQMAALITRLSATLDRATETLARASRSGMEVSEAMLRQREAQQTLVQARVAVHAFRVAAVEQHVGQGLKLAAETQRAGEAALRERDVRRMGLAISLVAILITIAGLWLTLRRIERMGTAVR